jgi:hypothetical protein
MAGSLELMSNALSARSGRERVLTAISFPISREFMRKYFNEYMSWREKETSDITHRWVNVLNQSRDVSDQFGQNGVPVPEGYNNILMSFPPDSIHYNSYNPPFAYLMVFSN